MQINVIYFGVHILIQKLPIANDHIASRNSEELLGVIVRSRFQNILKMLVPENLRQSTPLNSFKDSISTSNHMFKREIWHQFTEFTFLKL